MNLDEIAANSGMSAYGKASLCLKNLSLPRSERDQQDISVGAIVYGLLAVADMLYELNPRNHDA